MSVMHFRLHQNHVTWCGRRIVDSPTTTLNVVSLPDRHFEIMRVKFHYVRLTPDERIEERNLWNATVSQVTCKRCTNNNKRFKTR